MSRFYPNSSGTLTPKVSTWKPRLDILSKSAIGTDTNGDLVDKSNILSFDATIGTGGDYVTLADLITEINAGKKTFKAVGNIASTGGSSFTLPANSLIYIDLNGFQIDFASFQITFVATSYLQYENGTILYTQTVGNRTLHIGHASGFSDNNQLIGNNLTITNTSATAVNNTGFAGFGLFKNIIYNLNNGVGGGFGYFDSAFLLFRGVVNNCKFVGGGTSCIAGWQNGIFENIEITGNYNATNTFWFTNAENITVNTGINITINVGTNGGIGGYVNNIIAVGANLTLNLRQDITLVKAKCKAINDAGTAFRINLTDVEVADSVTLDNGVIIADKCKFVGTITCSSNNLKFINCTFGALVNNGNGSKFTNNTITGNLTNSGDNNTIIGNTISGTATLAVGSVYNVITGNTFTGGFTDNSGATNNEINNNIG